jgi:toxin secretion/phage lysis holin
MNDVRVNLNVLISFISTIGVYFLGGWDLSLQILLFFVIFDYLTGVIKAIAQKQLSSSIGFIGIAKKVGILIIVAAAAQIDKLIGWSDAPATRTMIIFFYISNEGISMLENLSALGVNIPKPIRDRLFKINSAGDDIK